MEEKKKEFYKKWWFWVCMVIIALIVGLVAMMSIVFIIAISGINEVALKVQAIDSEATLYSSAGGNIVVVEMPNYTDDTKKDKKEDIERIIKNYSYNGGILENYSKFIFITKMDSEGKENYFYSTSVYDLPSMTKVDSESKAYIEFDQSTIDNLESSSSTNETDKNTSTQTPKEQNTTTTTQNQKEQNATTTTQTTKKENTTTTTQTPKEQNTTTTTQNNKQAAPQTTSATLGEKNALSKAKSYLNYSAFSYKGLIEQLEFEGFSNQEATYGADNCGADWKEQAAKKAKSYMSYSSFSKNSLIEQLEFEGFTKEQAQYGATAVGY